ncbi:hypothetical protein DNI29_23215 [Hymenobacter sediminis]|uniref:hypothetical protein n=1 Tax=Hymenobacter sediminis TaxID=2218621 RepID=UPI000DA6C0FE|nr:hypothetical protein [Hymenobacter sediminis]RPD43772.1 hypothetical protein DNI29_23215 [Hymenobacter sediminis]
MQRNLHTIVLTAFLLLFVAFLTTCSEKRTTEPVVPAGLNQVELAGDIMLPTGILIDLNTLSIVSPVSEGTIQAGRYKVKTLKDKFTTQFVANSADKPLLLGYSYPGQTDMTISTRSTVLGLVMNMPAVFSLTSQAKLDLINRTLTDANFNETVQEVENVLRRGGSLLDNNNTALKSKLEILLGNVAKRGNGTATRPVRIFRVGRKLTFVNSGVAHGCEIGIYKDGQRVAGNFLGGYQVFVTSLGQVAEFREDKPTKPIEYEYTFPSEGKYDIVIRTGKPGTLDGTDEALKAQLQNTQNGVVMLFQAAVPILNTDREDGTPPNCALAFRKTILNLMSAGIDLNQAKDAASLQRLLIDVLWLVTDVTKDIAVQCSVEKLKESNFLKFFSNTLDFLGKLGNVANATAMTYHWMSSLSAQDTCYQVTATDVSACTLQRIIAVSGNYQPGVPRQRLDKPIRVQVLGLDGKPLQGATVFFTPLSGNGVAQPASTITGADGYAQCGWTLGDSNTPVQHLNVVAKTVGEQIIEPSPLDFNTGPPPAPADGHPDYPCVSSTHIPLLTGGASGDKIWHLVTHTAHFTSGKVLTIKPEPGCDMQYKFVFDKAKGFPGVHATSANHVIIDDTNYYRCIQGGKMGWSSQICEDVLTMGSRIRIGGNSGGSITSISPTSLVITCRHPYTAYYEVLTFRS